MKAMILAAGLGTRLRPLTYEKPKALVPILDRPVIARNIDYLKALGIKDIIVNAHYLSHQIRDYLDGGKSFGVNIEVRVEKEILGTGGGICNCSDFLRENTFTVINSDILTDIDMEKAYESHRRSGRIATMVLHDYRSFKQIKIDDGNRIIDIGDSSRKGRLSFACIHIMEPDIFSFIPDSGYSDIIDCYRRMIDAGISINAHVAHGHHWHDIGDPESYIQANIEMLNLYNGPFFIGPDSYIVPSVKFEEWAVIGGMSRLEKGVEIRRSILWNDVWVKQGVKIVDSIVTSHRVVEEDLNGEIY